MNMKLTKGLLGLGALLIAGQASAEIVSLSPATNNVAVGDIFTITVQGSEFLNGMSGGGVRLNWDTASVALNSTVGNINTSLFLNGFDTTFTIDDSVAGELLVTSATGFFAPTIPGPNFDFFSLDFLAVPPPSVSNLAIGIGTGGLWQDAAGVAIANADLSYNGASVTVGAVPVPAAAWLFGSGLIGLVGIARRKTQLV